MGYNLIIDTREQNPLPFRKCIYKKLDFGDYGAELEDGTLLPVVFERKSPMDCWSTITSDHNRFKNEIWRAMEAGVKLIVIVECSYRDFIHKNFDGSYNSKTKAFIVSKILHKLMVRYGLEFVFVNDRSEALEYIRNYFDALYEEYGS